MQPELNSTFFFLFTNPKFWIMAFTGPMICITADIIIKATRKIFVPSPSDQIQSKEKRLLAVERGMQILKFRQELKSMAKNIKAQLLEERENFKSNT